MKGTPAVNGRRFASWPDAPLCWADHEQPPLRLRRTFPGRPFAGRAVVSDVVDGDTVRLESAIDGVTQVRLVGIQAPKLPLGRPRFVAWPLARESKRALEAMVLGRAIRLSHGPRRLDRHGRLLAHLHVEDEAGADGLWVQGDLLRLGMARVYTFSNNRRLAAEMLALGGPRGRRGAAYGRTLSTPSARPKGRGAW